MSNRETLEEAGILDPNRNLTNDQYEAIESLSETEVGQLISIKNKLADISSYDPPGGLQPGINPVAPSEETMA